MGLTPAGIWTPRLRFKRRADPGSSQGGSELTAGSLKAVYGWRAMQTPEASALMREEEVHSRPGLVPLYQENPPQAPVGPGSPCNDSIYTSVIKITPIVTQ
ncbi:hypothetical protein NQZ68_001716 [Dissostichus eleginoides]|nr:hypothetical protein NQZ68_001716 [Dissostichus eleginoides]